MEAAREALLSNTQTTTVNVSGKTYETIPFGTSEKPFILSPRYVIVRNPEAGRIITTKSTGALYLSAVKIPIKSHIPTG